MQKHCAPFYKKCANGGVRNLAQVKFAESINKYKEKKRQISTIWRPLFRYMNSQHPVVMNWSVSTHEIRPTSHG